MNQAKQNLVTIGQDIATNIGDYITAPLTLAGDALQLQSDRLAVIQQGIVTKFAGTSAALAKSNAAISLRSAELSLQELRLSVPLPGGGQLSANPQEALKQLEAFGKTEPLSQQTYFQSFIDQYKTAVNAVQSAQIALAEATPVQRAQEQANIQLRQAELSAANDRANILKTAATNEINNWSSAPPREEDHADAVQLGRRDADHARTSTAFKNVANDPRRPTDRRADPRRHPRDRAAGRRDQPLSPPPGRG